MSTQVLTVNRGVSRGGKPGQFMRKRSADPWDTYWDDLHSPELTGTPVAPTPLAGDSSKKIATTEFVQVAVSALGSAFSGALVFVGTWDASAGVFPGSGTAKKGYFYKVSVAGTVDGVSFSVGDDVFAVTNNASTSTYANNWLKIEGLMTAAEVIAALGYTPLSPANNLSDVANAGTARTNLGLGIGVNVQAYSANLSTWAGIAPSVAVQSLVSAADAAGMKSVLSIGISDVSSLQTSLNLLAPKASPTFTGTVTVPTVAGTSDSSTAAASTAFVQNVVSAATSALVNGAPGLLDTLGEIATQLAADESTAAALATTVSGKLTKSSNLSDLTDASAARSNLGLAIGSQVQAYSANLAAWALLSTSAKQDASANLSSWSGIAPSAKQDASANLTAWSAIATSTKQAANAAIEGAWTGYTPSYWAPASGAFESFTATGRYRQVGKTVEIVIVATCTSNGTAAGGIDIELPVAALQVAGSHVQFFHGREIAVSGYLIIATGLNATRVRVSKHDYSHPGIDGAVLVIRGQYEAA